MIHLLRMLAGTVFLALCAVVVSGIIWTLVKVGHAYPEAAQMAGDCFAIGLATVMGLGFIYFLGFAFFPVKR